MRMLRGKYLFCIILVILVLAAFNTTRIRVAFVQVFKLDYISANHNPDGKLDGPVTVYVQGRIKAISNVVNGVKQGRETTYHENGNPKSKTYFRDGLPSGKGYAYNANGQLEYAGLYLNGQPYGSWYNYFENGMPKSYFLYDVGKNISFSVKYDSLGKMRLEDMHGFVVSSNFYSINPKNNKPVSLKPYPEINDISDINKDLMITVAKLKGARLQVTVDVNGSKYEFLDIKTNTLKIKNLLKKGKYDIFLKSYLYGDQDTVINGINIKSLLIVN